MCIRDRTNICAGAALMGEPDRLVGMVETIVDRVDVPVTAKMRLGTGRCTAPVHPRAHPQATILGRSRLDKHQGSRGGRGRSGGGQRGRGRCGFCSSVSRTNRSIGIDDWAWCHRATNRLRRHQSRFGVDEAPRFALGPHERCLARFDGDWAGVCFTQMVLGPLQQTVRSNGWQSGELDATTRHRIHHGPSRC